MRQIKGILIAFLSILVLFLIKELKDLILPLFYALFLAMLLQPLVKLMMRYFSNTLSVGISTVIAITLLFILVFGVYNIIHTFVVNSESVLDSINTKFRPFINNYTSFFGITFEKGELSNYITTVLKSGLFWSASGSFFNTISAIGIELFMTFLYLAGFLRALTNQEQTIQYLFDTSDRKNASTVFNRVQITVGKYMKIKTLVSLLTGICTGGICAAFQIEYFMLWGFLAFLLNYIPYVGWFIAVIPPLILSVIAFNNISTVFLLMLVLTSVQLFIGNILEPKWMGNSAAINTVSILFGFVFWAFLWGAPGLLLAVPLTFMFKVIMEQIPEAKIIVRLMDKKKFS